MKYPMNIFSVDPTTKSTRPYIIFTSYKLKFDVTKDLAYGSTIDLKDPQGNFTLPFPNNGLSDSSTNSYGEESSIGFDLLNKNVLQPITGKIASVGADNIAAKTGNLPDPRLTQVYNGTSSRSFQGDWIMIPQSVGESALCMAILWYVKYSASPERKLDNKIAVLEQPHVYKIKFSNGLLDSALQYDQMAIESYSINYFAQGYASTYNDMMPKMISLSLSFKEFGIKVKQDWIPVS